MMGQSGPEPANKHSPSPVFSFFKNKETCESLKTPVFFGITQNPLFLKTCEEKFTDEIRRLVERLENSPFKAEETEWGLFQFLFFCWGSEFAWPWVFPSPFVLFVFQKNPQVCVGLDFLKKKNGPQTIRTPKKSCNMFNLCVTKLCQLRSRSAYHPHMELTPGRLTTQIGGVSL